jgi:hypothetical protein
MDFNRILKAAFKIKNAALLSFVLIFSYVYFYPPFLLIGLAGYVFFVIQTLRSDDFRKEVSTEETVDRIRSLNAECTKLYLESRRRVTRSVDSRIKQMMAEKEDLMREFSDNTEDVIKQKIIEQALSLIKAYIKLMVNFTVRGNELIDIDVNKIKDRINANNRKMGFMRDPNAIADMQRAIDMDQKMLDRIEAEKGELERVSAKLDYMESTIRMFKHRMLTSDEEDGAFSEIEDIVNEATALDNVLNENRKSRLRI